MPALGGGCHLHMHLPCSLFFFLSLWDPTYSFLDSPGSARIRPDPPGGAKRRPTVGAWTAPTQLGCKGGGAKGKGHTAKGGEQWQQWKGKGKAGGKARSGDHTIPVSNYWEVLQGRKPQAVCPGGQRLQGTDEEPFVPIRNSRESFGKGRNLAPSRVVSQSASWGAI